jgi:hypothetical protein
MERDELLDMARQAGFVGNVDIAVKELEAFAKLVDAKATAKEREHYDDLFEQIKNWCEAYPISVFPEPDFGKAHEVLKANGMTLDAISASNMKHVITQVQEMIDAAIRARGQT